MRLVVWITVSPGYAYERPPDQQHFLSCSNTKKIFHDTFKRDHGRPGRSVNLIGRLIDRKRSGMPFGRSAIPRPESIEFPIRPAGGDALEGDLVPGMQIDIVELGGCEFGASLEAFYPRSILRPEQNFGSRPFWV
jgi:hypothetical protein